MYNQEGGRTLAVTDFIENTKFGCRHCLTLLFCSNCIFYVTSDMLWVMCVDDIYDTFIPISPPFFIIFL